MKKKSLLIICLVMALVLSLGVSSSKATKPFKGLADIPEIKNKRPIHVALEAGGGAEIQLKYIKKFSEKTGVPVTHELMLMSVVYPKVMPELVAGTGAYDCTVVETTWTNEWSPYLYSIDELAAKFDPSGVEGWKLDAAGIGTTMRRCASDRFGVQYGMPYYTYDEFLFVREDITNHPTEKANFKAKYGYELKIPKTWKEVMDQAEFFTRKKGALLKGEPLKHDFYGFSAMAGNFAHVHDSYPSVLWGMGGNFQTVVKEKPFGDVIEYVWEKKNVELMIKAGEFYRKLVLDYSSPGCKTGFWDYNTSQIAEGYAYMMDNYIPLDQWAFTVEEKVPGARLVIAPLPEAPYVSRGYVGNFYQGVTKASKNPEAAFWLMRYMGSYEFQKAAGEEGWASIRSDLYKEPQYKLPEWRTKIGARGEMLLRNWSEWSTPEVVDNYFHFNSKAAGRMYEMHILPLHQMANGMISVKDAVKWIITETITLEQKFGDRPIRVEEGIWELLKK